MYLLDCRSMVLNRNLVWAIFFVSTMDDCTILMFVSY